MFNRLTLGLSSGCVALLLGIGAETLGARPAQAGETCNFLNRSLWMAQAFTNAQNLWTSEGWWVIEPGDCVTYSDQALTYFHIDWGNPPDRPEVAKDRQKSLCVVQDRFTVLQADNLTACRTAGGEMVTFIQPDAGGEVLRVPSRD